MGFCPSNLSAQCLSPSPHAALAAFQRSASLLSAAGRGPPPSSLPRRRPALCSTREPATPHPPASGHRLLSTAPPPSAAPTASAPHPHPEAGAAPRLLSSYLSGQASAQRRQPGTPQPPALLHPQRGSAQQPAPPAPPSSAPLLTAGAGSRLPNAPYLCQNEGITLHCPQTKEPLSLWENSCAATTSWKLCAERCSDELSDVPPENETSGYIFIHAEDGLNQ